MDNPFPFPFLGDLNHLLLTSLSQKKKKKKKNYSLLISYPANLL